MFALYWQKISHGSGYPAFFFALGKAAKAQETQSYQRIQYTGHTDFNTSGTNGPRSLSWVKMGTHSAFGERSHTRAHTAKHGRFGWGCYHYPRSVLRSSETLRGQVSERQTLPLLGLGRGCSQRTQRAFGTAMRLCASLSRGVAAPLGCVIFSVSVEIAVCMPCSRYFFRFSRRSSLCRSCASCVSARSFSARSSMVFGRNRQDFLL